MLVAIVAAPLSAKTYVVTANADKTFTPASLTIYQHDQILFENAGGTHNVHAQNNSFICGENCNTNSGPSADLWQHAITFTIVGTFGYYCDAHASYDTTLQLCSGMCGSISVIDRIFVDGFEDLPSSSDPADRRLPHRYP